MAKRWDGIRISIDADPKYLDALRAVLAESTSILGLDEDETAKIALAVTEACANIFRHCYGGQPGERIDVEIRFETGLFEIRIADYGEFVDPAQMKGRALDDVKPGGLGLHFIHTVMDGVEYRKNKWGGTTLILQKRIEESAAAQDEFGFDDLDAD